MNYEEKLKREAVEVARMLLQNEEMYLDRILRLSNIGCDLYDQCWDTEFHIFEVIASETDHLPLQHVRQHCSKKMRENAAIELAETINHYKDMVNSACKEVITKHEHV